MEIALHLCGSNFDKDIFTYMTMQKLYFEPADSLRPSKEVWLSVDSQEWPCDQTWYKY